MANCPSPLQRSLFFLLVDVDFTRLKLQRPRGLYIPRDDKRPHHPRPAESGCGWPAPLRALGPCLLSAVASAGLSSHMDLV